MFGTAEPGFAPDDFVYHAPDAAPDTAIAPDTAPRPEVGLFDDAADLIDEEVLRDLVRDILREELQGTLGERITRNVRKLVRAEIARALAARDFG